MRLAPVLPILLPLATAAALLAAWRRPGLQRALGVAGAGAWLAAAGWLLWAVLSRGTIAVQIGDWPAPWGISVVADTFAALMVLMAAIVAFAAALYSLDTVSAAEAEKGFYPLLHALLAGVAGAFLTGDVFNLYVWFEVMLVASFVLMAMGGGREQTEGAIKYVALNLLASALFLSGAGLLYGSMGTLNMADLSVKLGESGPTPLLTAVAALLLTAFGVKAAVFPLYFWLPASYHTPPAAVAALFAGMLTKVGVYALFRVFSLLVAPAAEPPRELLLWVAGLTMASGVLGAVVQNDFRRILAFHSVSQIGYMIMGLALFSPAGLAGAIFFIVHHSIVKSSLFLVAGAVARLKGSYRLERLGGLFAESPAWTALFLVPALSLAGMPPFSGFIAKLALIRAGIEQESWAIVACALAVGLLTLLSMSKIFNLAFWRPGGGGAAGTPAPVLPVLLLAGVAAGMGLGAGPLFGWAERAAAELSDPAGYAAAVLGGRP